MHLLFLYIWKLWGQLGNYSHPAVSYRRFLFPAGPNPRVLSRGLMSCRQTRTLIHSAAGPEKELSSASQNEILLKGTREAELAPVTQLNDGEFVFSTGKT